MKISTLIDSNVLIDVLGPANTMTGWSASALDRCRHEGQLVINTIVWSELAPLAAAEAILEAASDDLGCSRESIPWNAAYLAGKAHGRYRRSGGSRDRTLPDFLIGAHAAIAGHRVLTRDASNYRKYFSDVDLITPETHP